MTSCLRLGLLFGLLLTFGTATLAQGSGEDISKPEAEDEVGSAPIGNCRNAKSAKVQKCRDCPEPNAVSSTIQDFQIPHSDNQLLHCVYNNQTAGSFIDNFSFNHHHMAADYQVGQGAPGCLGCGGGDASNDLLNLYLMRIHRLRDMTTPTSNFGPGVFSNYDIHLSLYPSGTGRILDLFDPQDLFTRRLVDGLEGDTKDGVFQNLRSRSLKEMTLLNQNGNPTADLAAARQVELDGWKGNRFVFELINLAGAEPSDAVGQWLLDEGSGAVATDAVGTDNGTINGNATWSSQTSQLNGDAVDVLNFDGVDDAVSFPSRDFGDAFSIALWVKASDPGGQVTILSNRVALPTASGFSLFHLRTGSGDHRFQFTMADGSSTRSMTAPLNRVTFGEWNHLAAVIDKTNGNGSIYINGVQVASSSNLLTNFKTSSSWFLGKNSNNKQYYQGQMYDLQVFDRELLPQEIVAIAQRELYGRLVEAKDRNDYGATIAYKSFTPAELAASPDRQWQIDSVTDSYGRSANFHYNPLQQSGRWVIEKIDLPNGEDIDYHYTNGQLSSVDHADGTTSTIGYSTNAASQCTVVSYFEAAADPTHRKKEVYLTNSNYFDAGGGETIYNQSSMLVRLVVNGEDEVAYMNVATDTGNGAIDNYIYEGTGRVQQQRNGRRVEFLRDGWTYNPAATGNAIFVGTTEGTFEETKGYSGEEAFRRGVPREITNAAGNLFSYEYDADESGWPTKKTYTDTTTEEWEYNQFKQVTRYKDRLNRVTKFSYDARGNLLTQEVGILEVSGNDVQQPEYAIYQWEYFPAGHPNQFLLSASIDANNNRTDYEYNANQFLVKVTEPADNTGDPRAETEFTYDTAGRLKTSIDPANRTTTYFYDQRDRLIQVQYLDGSTERTAYGQPGSGEENLVVAVQDRTGFVTTMEYDDHGRMTKRITASHRIPQNLVADNTQTDLASLLTGNEVTDINVRVEYTCSYLDGTSLRSQCTDRGESTSYVYDYRQRLIESTVQPRIGKTLTSSTTYVDNLVFCTEDPYGRKSYAAYRASDSAFAPSEARSLATAWRILRLCWRKHVEPIQKPTPASW